MTVNCLPVSDFFCVPSAYESVWEPGGISVRQRSGGLPFTITGDNLREAGASINLMSKDNLVLESIRDWSHKNVTGHRIYYKSECEVLLKCVFRFAKIRTEKIRDALRDGVITKDIKVVGYNIEGRNKVFDSIYILPEPRLSLMYFMNIEKRN